MTIAPSHVPVSVLSINEINPMTDTKSIYDGTYKFSRKIYLLTRQNSTSSVVKLADFLQSPAGQKLVTNAGYLPIIPSN
jgi:ABC-type phosphate transport system substrate-binding protein